jgi:hypothetical protein
MNKRYLVVVAYMCLTFPLSIKFSSGPGHLRGGSNQRPKFSLKKELSNFREYSPPIISSKHSIGSRQI